MIAPRERALLEERARALARPLATPPRETVELLTFRLSGERYAIESRYALTVFRLRDLSLLPDADAPVFGITTYRGALLIVLDLRPVLGLSVSALNDMGYVVVVGHEAAAGGAFGVLVDEVHELLAIPAAAIQLPVQGVVPRTEFVQGVTPDAVVVLAADKLLAVHV